MSAEKWVKELGTEDALIRVADDFYNTQSVKPWDEGTRPEPEPVKPDVRATETGVNGNNVFKIVDIKAEHTEEGSDAKNAIDNRKSTAYKGNGPLICDIGGIGLIRTVGLKINEKTSFVFKTSKDGANFTEVVLGSLTDDVETSGEFTYFIFPDQIPARYVSVDTTDDTKSLNITTLQLLEIDPDPTGLPDPDSPPPGPVEPSETGFPIPAGIKTIGKASVQEFKHWGRHETNYASGGSGPSERWDNEKLPSTLNVLAGYEVNLGEAKGKRGDDNFDLKFRGSNHSDSNGGWYIPSIEWSSSGKDGVPKIGKEYPHPKTEHLNIQESTNAKVGNVKGDFWIGYLGACFNDKKGVPTIMLWCKPKDKTEYVYMGKSKDTGNMKPGPALTKIGMKGSTKQVLQIRMDEVPERQNQECICYRNRTS